MCGTLPCHQHVMRIGCSSPSLPHVFVSGAMHGDERLGPVATVEFGALLMRQYGRSSWATRIVDSRCIVLFPVANAVGYYMREREDNGVDPNRDFAYERHDCFKSLTARSINELFRSHAFVLAVNFHAGAELLGWPWGDSKHCKRNGGAAADGLDAECVGGGWDTADSKAMQGLGEGLARIAGGVSVAGGGAGGVSPYRTGAINEVIYSVRGGFEDWAYAGSWGAGGGVCTDTGASSYPAAQSTYTSDMLRTINFLIETTNDKR